MNREKLIETRNWIRSQLDSCADFWLKNGMDGVHGGVYTCLDREGKIFSTDKSVWMQGRCGWIYAWLCRTYGVREEWLKASKSCLDFLEEHCVNRGAGDRLYFTVTEDGQPLRQRRYCFSEAFYCIANAEYYGITGEKEHLERALKAYDMYWNLNHGMPDPTGMGPKTVPETRTGRALGIPMILLNVTAVLKRVNPENSKLYDERANETGDKELHAKAVEIFDLAFNAGWDKEYGGILYFIDCLGNPPEAYEHDMKLWWPHNEALIAALMIYRDTNDEKYLDIFYQVLDYCKQYFADEPFGEWYGYLRRDGKPTQPACKGSTFKGPFHVPRCLSLVDMMIGEILEK